MSTPLPTDGSGATMDASKTAPAAEAPKATTSESAPAAVAAPAPTVDALDDAPDPDEDDLDDLDDMLDDFSTVNINSKQPATASGPGRPAEPATNAAPSAPSLSAEAPLPGGAEEFSEEEFQRQLQAGMAELMSDLENSPDMQKQFESIFQGLGGGGPGAPFLGGAGPSTAGAGAGAGAGAAPQGVPDLGGEASFQETIRKTMERMQASGDEATAAATAKGAEDDFIAEMMKAMKDLPGNDGSEEDFTKMLMGMMEQLTNKEILYEPMKELHDKFPDWLAKNEETLPKDDLDRYTEQQVLVAEMVKKFEEPTYADENAADREYIVDRMQRMQAAGSPPPDLVGDMPSAKEAFGAPDESCAPQ